MNSILEVIKLIYDKIHNMKKPLVLSIAGPTCSGKTTLAQGIIANPMFGSYHLAQLCLDSYMRSFDDPSMPTGEHGLIFDHPQAFMGATYRSAVAKLMMGKSVKSLCYDVGKNRQLGEGEVIEPPDILVAEGLFVLSALEHLEVRKFNVFIDTPKEVCLKRRIERDCALYGVSASKVIECFEEKVWPESQPFMRQQKLLAHLIINLS
jgi:uridine kinase